MNRFVKASVIYDARSDEWYAEVVKEFANENGGGTQVFREYGGKYIHAALDVLRGMVTAFTRQTYRYLATALQAL